MPLYGTVTAQYIPLLTAGQQALVFDDEAITAGQSSQQVQLRNVEHLRGFYAVEFQFSAAPGTFRIELQHASTDDDEHYFTMAAISGGLNAAFVGRIEMPDVVAKYARLQLLALENPVNLTAGYAK